MTRVLLADDHVLFREAVRVLLEEDDFDIVGEVSDGLEAVEKARELKPDVIIMDISMPTLSGIEAVKQIRADDGDAKIVFLTVHDDESYMLEACQVGAKGYVLKDQTEAELARTVSEVAKGAFYMGPNVPASVFEALTSNKKVMPGSLSERELEVVDLIAEGMTSRQIAEKLGLSPKTIESHRRRIMQKLNFSESSQLVSYAVKSQWTRH